MNDSGIERDFFGNTTDGVPVYRYTLRNSCSMKVRVITYGATVTELWTPDRQGIAADVVLGFDNLAQYESQHPYFGCMVGRVAFRIANAEFVLDGKPHQLTRNCGEHHAHGGTRGFSHAVWQAEPLYCGRWMAIKLTHHSPDGDQGYPGAVDVSVIYTLTEENELLIDCAAATDRPTPINLTHHGYFNLTGAGNSDVLGHVLQIDADRWSTTDEQGIPTGEIVHVKDTPFDFTRPTPIGSRIEQTGGKVSGYDLAYLHNQAEGSLAQVAAVHEPSSGRTMEVSTTEPAIVLYTGNCLDGTLTGKRGVVYPKHAGVCLETGRLPDSVHFPDFPSTVVRPECAYHHICVYKFGTTSDGQPKATRPVSGADRGRLGTHQEGDSPLA